MTHGGDGIKLTELIEQISTLVGENRNDPDIIEKIAEVITYGDE